MAIDDIDLKVNVNDDALLASLTQIDKSINNLEKEANQAGKSMSNAFDKAEKEAKDLTKAVGQTEKALKGATAQGEKIGGGITKSLRGIRSELRLVNTIPNLFGMAVGAFQKARQALEFYNETFNATSVISKVVQSTVEDNIGAFIKEQGTLNDLKAVVESETTSKKDKLLAIEALKKQFPDYFNNLTLENAKTGELTTGYNNATAAIEANSKAKIKAEILTKLQTDAALKILAAQQAAQTAEAAANFDQLGGFNKLLISSYADAQASLATSGAKTAATAAQNIKGVSDAVDAVFALLTPAADQIKGVTDTTTAGLKELAGTSETTTKKQIEQNKALAGSIADLEAQLAKVNEQIRSQTEAGDTNALQPLIKSAETLEAQLKAANEALDKLRKPKEVEKTADSGANDAQLTADEVFKIRENAFNQSVALAEATLRQQQAAEELRLKQSKATEEQITALQETQEKERQKLALETEQRRLNFILQYGAARTEAETATVKAQLAAITDELKAFGIEAETAVSGGKKRKSFFEILGLDPNTEEGANAIAGIEKGIGMAIDGLSNLFAQQVQIAEQEVALRDENISRLQTQLEQELALNEQGFASNVQATQKALAEENKARDKALKEQKKAQTAQLVLDTIMQASNLITAASEIFSSFAALPFGIGIPIAVGVIGAMAGAFIASKALAFKAVKLSDGGRLPSVLEGGRTDIGSGEGHRIEGTNFVVGGGEFIVPEHVTDNQLPFLEKLRKGEYNNIDLVAALEGKSRRVRIMGQAAENVKTVNFDFDKQLEKHAARLEKSLHAILEKPNLMLLKDGEYLEITHKPNGSRITKHVKIK